MEGPRNQNSLPEGTDGGLVTPTRSMDQVLVTTPSLRIGGPLGPNGDMVLVPYPLIPLVLALPMQSITLRGTAKRFGPTKFVITCLKGVKHEAVALQLGVAGSRPRKKALISCLVLAAAKWGFFGLGKSESSGWD